MNDVVRKDEQATETMPAQAGSGDSILSMIQAAASNPNTDVEKLERMFALYERQQDREAQAAYNRAMTKAQSEMRRVSADAVNPQTASNYATYAALDKALRPIYTKHGFALSFDTGDAPAENYVRVICHVSHEEGHTVTHRVDMPADGLGIKGNRMMTKTHASASAMSYGMRYLLKMIFNVAIGEDDDDGNSAGDHAGYITNEQLADMIALKDELGDRLNPEVFTNWLRDRMGAKDGKMENIPARNVQRVFQKMEKFRKEASA